MKKPYLIDATASLHSVQSMRALEQSILASSRLDAYALMQRAGQAVFERARSEWPFARCIRVFCGGGNNGGDGYIVASLARRAGLKVQLIRVGGGGEAVEANAARTRYLAEGGHEYAPPDLAVLRSPDLLIDAVFGIGLRRPPADEYAAAINAINAAQLPVLSIDMPSGLDADTGATPGDCVQASLTLALIAWKRGLFTGRARVVVGKLMLDDLGYRTDLDTGVGLPSFEDIQRLLQPRARDAHKGRFGHVLVVGGDHGMGGAALLAGEAALRGGAGWVSVATRGAHVPAFLSRRPELMAHACDDVQLLQPLLGRADVIALGPGLGHGEWGRALLDAAMDSGKPLVIDADALNLIAASAISIGAQHVSTPHPGEAARLLGCPVAEIESDRFAAMERLLQRCGGSVVLKGAGTLVGTPGRVDVCSLGNPGMASAGMGDVLTGLIAAMRAQGMSPFDAARVGVWAHASAGDAAAATRGERGLVAGDLLACIGGQINP